MHPHSLTNPAEPESVRFAKNLFGNLPALVNNRGRHSFSSLAAISAARSGLLTLEDPDSSLERRIRRLSAKTEASRFLLPLAGHCGMSDQQTIEQRLAEVEKELADLKRRLPVPTAGKSWVEQIAGRPLVDAVRALGGASPGSGSGFGIQT